MHWPEPDEDVEEGWSTMLKLKEEGKVRWIGVSNFNVPQMKRAMALGPITSLQPPYHLLNRGIEVEVLPFTEANGIGVINYSPMASGLLSGTMTRERLAQMPADDWRKSKNANYQEPLLTRNLKLVELLREIGQKHGRSAGEVAIAWTLRKPAVTAAIVGARRHGQVKGFIGAATFRLTALEIERIEVFLRTNPV
jgi:aryl-alcohol dehydrogenase-like predicted oxidoreductase